MEKKETIVAITVTFNRVHTLENTLRALLNSSRKVDAIVVSDNCSNRENQERLKQLVAELSSKECPIYVVWLSDNLGGAGGFEAGMKFAKENLDPDWYWIMDDDAYPRENTLENLLKHKTLPKLGALLPVIYGVDWKEYQLYHAKTMYKHLTKEKPKFQSIEEMQAVNEVDADAFVGPLFPKKVVDSCGFADGSLFIYGDDTEYTTRVHQKYKLYLIRDAVIDHNDPPKAGDVFSYKTYWKLYYTVRNRILLAMKYNKGLKKILAFGYLTKDFLWQVGYSLVRKNLGKSRFLRLQMVCKAYLDGLAGQKGKTVDPVKFVKNNAKYEEN